MFKLLRQESQSQTLPSCPLAHILSKKGHSTKAVAMISECMASISKGAFIGFVSNHRNFASLV